MNYNERMNGQVRFPMNPMYSVGLIFTFMLLGKIVWTNNLILQLALGVCTVFAPSFLSLSSLDGQKKRGSCMPMFAGSDETC